MEVDMKVVEQKILNKEPLSKEETQAVMESVDDPSPETQEMSDEELGFDPEDKGKGKEKKEEKTPPADDKKDGDAKTGEAKKAPEADKAKEAAKVAEPKKEEKADEGIYQKVQKELDKPDGQEDLSDMTDREKGLYYALKGERKKRQKAEEDRDVVLFERIKERKLAETKAAEKEQEPEFKIEGDDEEFITVKQANALYAAIKGGKRTDGTIEEVEARNRNAAIRIAEMSARDVIEARRAGGKDLPDYDTAMKIIEVIVDGNPEYQKEIYTAFKLGKNPALTIYDLGIKDPKFAVMYGKKAEEKPKEEAKAKDDKAKEGKETLKKIEENEGKPKTSGAQGSGGAGTTGEEYTLDKLLTMKPSEFRKVPKAIREKFLYNT